MDFVQATLDGETVNIVNITGSEKNTSISYVDSSGNLKVKVKPLDWSLAQSLSTSSTQLNIYSNGIIQTDGLLQLNGVDRSFNNLRKALSRARIGGGNARIVLVGDSTVTGMGARLGGTEVSACRSKSIGKHMADLSQQTLYLPGNRDSFFGYGVITNGSDYTNYNAYDPRIVLSGAIGYDSVGGTLGAGPFKMTSAGQTLKFTPDNPFTHSRIYSINNQASFGSANVLVDNVFTGNVLSGVGGTGLSIRTIAVSGSSITISALENKTFDLIGIETWNANKPGISILEAGWAGSFMSNMASSANPYNHAKILASLSADCIIIKCSTNDCIAPTSKESYKNSLSTLISLQSSASDIYFADLYPSSYQDGKPTILNDYKNAAKELNIPVLDLRNMFGYLSSTAISNGLAIGTIHPGEISYALIATMIMERLKPWI